MKFRDPNHVSNTPKVWNAPNGRRIEWRSDRQPFDAFYVMIREYSEANSLPVPSVDEVTDAMCRQMPKWACVDNGYHSKQSFGPGVAGPSTPCRTCGKRR